jgi:sugar phosphate isomerase/epimerase
MKKGMRAVVLLIVTATLVGPAEAPAQAPGGTGGLGSGARRGRAESSGPAAGSASVRESGSSLGRIRLGAADPIWFTWQVNIPANAFQPLTFTEAAAKADALGLAYIEGFDNQKVSPEIPKNLDYNLFPGERAAITNRLRELNVRMPAYHVDSIGPDDPARRKLFEFAKSLGVETIISAPEPALLPDLDKLANEFGINVAVESRSRKETPAYWEPKSVAAAMGGCSKRIGISADIGNWMQEGIKPLEGLLLVKDRLMAVNLRDRSVLGGCWARTPAPSKRCSAMT